MFSLFRNILLLISTVILLVACNPKEAGNPTVAEDSNKDIQTIEGIVAEKSTSRNTLLVIPNVEQEDFEELDEHAFYELASKKGAIHFYVSEEEFEAHALFDPVTVEYDANGDVEESDPPIHSASEITAN